MSNPYAIMGALQKEGFDTLKHCHINDDKGEIFKVLKEILLNFDIVILSGRVSMGKYDYIPMVLNELNVKKIFHKIIDGRQFAIPIKTNGLGDYASLVKSDGFIELEKDKEEFPEGSVNTFIKWK